MPKSKSHKRSKSQTIKATQNTLKAVRSVIRAENLNTEETNDESFYQLKDYDSNQNSIICRGSKKNVVLTKNNKIKRIMTKKKADKSQHFMSYDVRSSLNKYELMNQPCLVDTSMDKSVSKDKKRMKGKRNSSITKIHDNGMALRRGWFRQTTEY